MLRVAWNKPTQLIKNTQKRVFYLGHIKYNVLLKMVVVITWQNVSAILAKFLHIKYDYILIFYYKWTLKDWCVVSNYLISRKFLQSWTVLFTTCSLWLFIILSLRLICVSQFNISSTVFNWKFHSQLNDFVNLFSWVYLFCIVNIYIYLQVLKYGKNDIVVF